MIRLKSRSFLIQKYPKILIIKNTVHNMQIFQQLIKEDSHIMENIMELLAPQVKVGYGIRKIQIIRKPSLLK